MHPFPFGRVPHILRPPFIKGAIAMEVIALSPAYTALDEKHCANTSIPCLQMVAQRNGLSIPCVGMDAVATKITFFPVDSADSINELFKRHGGALTATSVKLTNITSWTNFFVGNLKAGYDIMDEFHDNEILNHPDSTLTRTALIAGFDPKEKEEEGIFNLISPDRDIPWNMPVSTPDIKSSVSDKFGCETGFIVICPTGQKPVACAFG
jgi:hypothetical protein